MPAIPGGMTIPGPRGLVVIPNPLAKPMFDMLPLLDITPIPLDRAASLDSVEFVGESISMLSIALTLLLCLRCLFGPAVPVRGKLAAAAPGPGVSLSGAAAIGTTPLPPLTAAFPAEEPADP